MTPVPLPDTIKGSQVLPKQSEYTVNLLKIGTALVNRPSLVRVKSQNGENRGQFVYGGVLYNVIGQNLYSGTALTLVGTLLGSEIGRAHV